MKLIVTDIRQILSQTVRVCQRLIHRRRPNGTGPLYEFILQTHSFSRVPTRNQNIFSFRCIWAVHLSMYIADHPKGLCIGIRAKGLLFYPFCIIGIQAKGLLFYLFCIIESVQHFCSQFSPSYRSATVTRDSWRHSFSLLSCDCRNVVKCSERRVCVVLIRTT